MIHRIYAELLKNYSSGHALYYPIPADKVRPGALGYFDGTGAWQSLANDVKSVEWPIPPFTGNLQTTADPAYQVDEFRSEGTLKVGGKFGLNARYDVQSCFSRTLLKFSVPSTPVTAGLDVDGDRDVERVAVLKCGPIIKEYLQSGITDLKTWGKDSAKYILEREPLTRQYGFFIVTAMRKTNRCEILCTTKRNYKFSPSVSASVPAAGSLKASGHIDQDDKLTPGWIRRPVDNAVVFASFSFPDIVSAATRLHRLCRGILVYLACSRNGNASVSLGMKAFPN